MKENQRLRKELEKTKKEAFFLKKAAAFFQRKLTRGLLRKWSTVYLITGKITQPQGTYQDSEYLISLRLCLHGKNRT